MDNQFTLARTADGITHFRGATIARWLGDLFASLKTARLKRHRCADILAIAMRDSAAGG